MDENKQADDDRSGAEAVISPRVTGTGRAGLGDEATLLFGQARFERYLKDADGDVDRAVALCRWNQRFAGMLHGQLGFVELAVRNAFDRRLRELAVREKGAFEWCLPGNAPDLVHGLVAGTLRDANERARADANKRAIRGSHRANTAVTHDDVLAQLMWGTWVKLIGYPETGEKTVKQQELWKVSTRSAFPHAPDGERGRIQIARGLQYIRSVRNSEAHFDNLYREARSINTIIGTAMSLLNSIDPALTRNWIDTAMLRRTAKELKSFCLDEVTPERIAGLPSGEGSLI